MKAQVVTVVQSLEAVKEITSQDLPISVAFKLLKVVEELQKVSDLFNEKRNNLIKEIGDAGENDQFSVPPEKMGEFTEALNPVLIEEVDLDCEQIPMSVLETTDVKISAANLMAIKWLLS